MLCSMLTYKEPIVVVIYGNNHDMLIGKAVFTAKFHIAI